MYIKDSLTTDTKIYFCQETMDKSSRMITIDYGDNAIELYCSLNKAKDLANNLLESINKFEDRYGK